MAFDSQMPSKPPVRCEIASTPLALANTATAIAISVAGVMAERDAAPEIALDWAIVSRGRYSETIHPNF